MWGLSSRVSRRTLSYRMLSVSSRKCYGWCDSRPSIQKREFCYGQVEYVCFHETQTSKVGIVIWYSWNWKLFSDTNKAMFIASISKSVYYAFDFWERDPEERLPYNERWIKQQLNGKGSVRRVLVRLSCLGSPGLSPLLSWVLLLRVWEILKVKLLEV